LQEPETLVDEEVEPAALGTRRRYLLVGIANGLEVELPLARRAGRERLRLTRDRIDLTAGRTNLRGDAFCDIAPQLGATGGSPEAAVENQNHERVLAEGSVEPSAPRSRRRIEFCGRARFVAGPGVGETHVVAVPARGHTERSLFAAVPAAEDKAKLARSRRRQRVRRIDNAGNFELVLFLAVEPRERGVRLGLEAIGDRVSNSRHVGTIRTNRLRRPSLPR